MCDLNTILHVTANIRSAQSKPGVSKLWPMAKNELTPVFVWNRATLLHLYTVCGHLAL